MKRTWYLHMGDNHAGLSKGLTAPGTVLDWGQGDEREILLSDWSDWLWHEVWMPGLEMVKDKTGGEPFFVMHSGDVTHGSRHIRDDNLYSPHITHQLHITKHAFVPVRDMKNLAGFYIVSGTGSHDYGGSSASLKVRDQFASWGLPVFHSDHILMNFDGFRFDLAHHGPYVSKLDHTRVNTARRDVGQLLKRDMEWGRPSAHLYQRGHVHMPVHTQAQYEMRNETRRAEVIITPPMCGPNGYARAVTHSLQEVTCGFYLSCYDHDHDILTVFPWLKNKDTRAYHTVKVELPYHKRDKKKNKKKKG